MFVTLVIIELLAHWIQVLKPMAFICFVAGSLSSERAFYVRSVLAFRIRPDLRKSPCFANESSPDAHITFYPRQIKNVSNEKTNHNFFNKLWYVLLNFVYRVFWMEKNSSAYKNWCLKGYTKDIDRLVLNQIKNAFAISLTDGLLKGRQPQYKNCFK